MIASIAQEEEIIAEVMSMTNDPVGFVHYAYPWGQAGTIFANSKGPRKWQLEELELMGEHVRAQEFARDNDLPQAVYRLAISSGRGPGKSALFGMLAHWHMSTRLGSTCIVAANTESQLRTKTFPEFANWFGSAINAHWFSRETMRIAPAPWLLELMNKPKEEGGYGTDPKYWYCAGQTWNADNPAAFAGAHNSLGLMVLFDESNGIVPGVWDVTEGFYTEAAPYRFWVAASQMRNREGRFHDLFYDEQMGKGWRTRTVSTRGMPEVDQTLVEDQIARYGEDSDWVRTEIMGLPPRTSEDQFVSWDALHAAQQNTLAYDYGEPLILGVDPAPRGKTAWRFRQGRNARDCCGSLTAGNLLNADNVQIAERILELDAKYKPDAICIDFGMGTGVIDILKRRRTHGRLHEVKFGNAPSDKDTEWATRAIELWAKLRDWLPGGMLEKDDGSKGSLSQQLTDRGWRWSGREDGKKILETKDEMQRRGVKSPDDADALACTFEVNPPRRDHVRSPVTESPRAPGSHGQSFFFE